MVELLNQGHDFGRVLALISEASPWLTAAS
jgi:hypothetical protein